MAKIQNPYTKILDEINESLSLHKLESTKITRVVIETKLEENVKKYINDPKIQEIRSKKKISEDDQGYLDINILSSSYYKTKLDLSKEYTKEYKKFLDVVSDYKSAIDQRVTNFELNASLIAKFTKEELEKNPKLSKMMSDAPEGLDNVKKKYEKLDATLSKIFAEFNYKNSEDYAEKLYDFLYESKQFRKKFMEEKRAEIAKTNEHEEQAQKEIFSNQNLFGKSQEEFNLLREQLINEEKISTEQLNELKTYSSKIFTAVQIASLNKFEEELFDEYSKFNSTDRIIKQRLAISLSQFNKGVDDITDLIVESGTNTNIANALEVKFNGGLYEKKLEDIKHDPAFMNLCVGNAACLFKYIEDQNKTQKKNFFGKVKIDLGLEKLIVIHKNLCDFLTNQIGIEADLLNNNILGTMITEAKMQELAYSLMNNVSRISNTLDVGDWQEGVNRLVSRCIFSMVSSIESNKDPLEDVKRFENQYLTTNLVKEKEEETRTKKINRIRRNGDMSAVIRAILG